MNFKLHSLVATTLVGSFLLGFGANALADSTDDIVNALMAKGVLTEEEGALLLKGRSGEKEASDKKKESAVSAKFKDGLSFESGDGKFKAQINGRVHTDYRNFDHDDGARNPALAPATVTNSIANVNGNTVTDTFDLRRARLGFKVNYKDYYEGEVVADLTDGGATVDVANLNVAWWQPAQFKFGIFKMPMNLEELTSSNNIDFQERSFVNQLAPGKEIGAMLHGSPFKGITYGLAVSNGNAKLREADIREDGKDVIGRVTANFAEMMDNKEMVLHTGLSFSQGDTPEGQVGISGRTEGRGATFFRAPTLANAAAAYDGTDRTRFGVEGAVGYGPFKLQAEWLQQNNDFKTVVRDYDVDIKNWYVQGLWTISGENYADAYKNGSFGSRKPKNDFDPSNFSGGLWEVGVRYSEFDASDYNTVGIANGTVDAAFGAATSATKAAGFSKADAWSFGVKFLPNANMRFMLNYVMTDFSDVIGGATGGVIVNQERIDDEKALIARAQWMF